MGIGIPTHESPDFAKHLPVFDGYPYLTTRLVPGLYHVILLPEELSQEELIGLGACQALLNQLQTCLVVARDACYYYGSDGSWVASNQPPTGGILIYGKLKPFKALPPTLNLIERHARLVAFSPRREGYLSGDVTHGGRPATPEEIQRLKGEQPNGVPVGLVQCPRCSGWKGECLDPRSLRFSISAVVRRKLESDKDNGGASEEANPEPWVIPVDCACENRNRCAACGRLLYPWKLNSNYFDVAERRVWHVPGFCGLSHRCEQIRR